MSDVLIHQAGDADVEALTRLRQEWTNEQDPDGTDPDFAERFADWFVRESAHRITWLADAGGRPVGMVNLTIFDRMPRPWRAPSRWGYLGNAFVLAAFRNQGIGRQLLGAVLRYADESGLVRVVLSPSERSVPFYQRGGFGPADDLMLRTLPL
jgi:GNAT superfamily N-acetyltransferase